MIDRILWCRIRESGELRLSLSYGQADAPEAAYAPGSGITGQVFAEGKPIVVPCMQGRADFQNRLFGRSAGRNGPPGLYQRARARGQRRPA